MTDQQEAAAISAAVKAASETRSITFIPTNAGPAMVEALTAHAVAENKMILPAPHPSRSATLVREFGARDVPSIRVGDDRSFLENLDKIASGKMKVLR